MDIFEAIRNRRSCRRFLPEPVDDAAIEAILDAATWAPSPLNAQPWRFIVITSAVVKLEIFTEAERCRQWATEKSGWKWLGKYAVDFLKQAPVLIAVVGDATLSGMDQFQAEGPVGYHLACAAAVQNMLLAAHALRLGSLWFTLYDKSALRAILDIAPDQTPVALVCIGKPAAAVPAAGRKDIKEKTTHLG